MPHRLLFATFIFVALIPAITEDAGLSKIAGLIIGLALVVIHIVSIPVTGVSVNPARSFGLAFWSGSASAWLALPLFLIVPTIGGVAAGLLNKVGILSPRDDDGAGEEALNDLTDRVKKHRRKLQGRPISTTDRRCQEAQSGLIEMSN